MSKRQGRPPRGAVAPAPAPIEAGRFCWCCGRVICESDGFFFIVEAPVDAFGERDTPSVVLMSCLLVSTKL